MLKSEFEICLSLVSSFREDLQRAGSQRVRILIATIQDLASFEMPEDVLIAFDDLVTSIYNAIYDGTIIPAVEIGVIYSVNSSNQVVVECTHL